MFYDEEEEYDNNYNNNYSFDNGVDLDNEDELYEWFQRFIQREVDKSSVSEGNFEYRRLLIKAEMHRDSVLGGGREDFAGKNQGFWRIG
jgi:hypothetical protein